MDDDFDDDNWRQARRELRGHLAALGRISGYWSWEPHPKLAELHAAEVLLKYLRLSEPDIGKTAFPIEQAYEPPDAFAERVDGRRVGIEVTELVNGKLLARWRKCIDEGRRPPNEYTLWTPETCADALTQRIQVKDRKLAQNRAQYDELVLCIVTDELSIDEKLAAKAVELTSVQTAHLSKTWVILGYNPNTNEKKYPDKCAIFLIA